MQIKFLNMRNPLLLTLWLLSSLSILALTSATADATVEDNITTLATQKSANKSAQIDQQVVVGVVKGAHGEQAIASKIQKCSAQSTILTRQTLTSELEQINQFNSFWFNDLDKDELIEEQKESLRSLIMSAGNLLSAADSQPLIDIETSYLRPVSKEHVGVWSHAASDANQSRIGGSGNNNGPASIQIKLVRRQQDRCYLHKDKAQYTLVFGLAVGPFEHNMDVIYNLPKELRLSQPMEWKYGQVKLLVNKMNYEVTIKQEAQYNKISMLAGCPLEVADVTYLNSAVSQQTQVNILTSGLASTNETQHQLKRLFNHYTRPTISNRLRQALKFYLNAKTLPLSVSP